MAKTLITYGDKVTGGIPKAVHEQQWWFDDANETKSAINLNATELYDRTDGNMPSQLVTAKVNWSNLSSTVQEQDLIWAAVNADPTTIVLHDHILKFRTIRKVYGQVGSIDTYDVIENIWSLRDKLKVTAGANVSLGLGNTLLDNTNGILVPSGRKVTKVVGGVVQEGGFTRDFGVTGATPIEDSVNTGTIAYPSKGLYLFKGNDGVDDYLYIYEGDASEIGTGSGVTTSASDFSILTEASADPADGSQQTIKIQGDTGEGEFPLAVDLVGANVSKDISTGHAIITITNGGLNVSGFGAKGDGIQLSDFNVTGSNLNSPTAVFTAKDIGKVVSIADAAGTGDHLVTTILAFVDTNNVTLSDAATLDVTNKLGSYGTDNIKPLQDAFNYAIANNVKIYAPEGVYLIGDTNPDDITFHDVRILFTAEGQNFHLTGAGKGLTIFRELDGKTKRIGRFTKIFHCPMASFNIGHLFMDGFTMDKNGRSLLTTSDPLYDLEQAHCINFSKTASDRYIWQSATFKNIEIFDKIGGGISWSVSNVEVRNILGINITSNGYTGNEGAVQYGQRADIEIHAISQNYVLQDCRIDYSQFEPSGAYATSETYPRTFKLINCVIDDFEPTEITNDDDLAFGRVEMVNCKVKSFTPRGLPVYVTGGEVTINTTINSTKARFKGVTIKIPYDSIAGSVQTISFANYTSIKNRWVFDDCDFEIDSTDPLITPTGYAITNGGSLDDLTLNDVTIRNSRFDKRFDATLDAQGNGKWTIENCLLAGLTRAALVGAASTNESDVTFRNNDYSQLADSVTTFLVKNSNFLYQIAFYEEVPHLKFQTGSTGTTAVVDEQINRHVVKLIDDIANRSGTVRKGEIYKIINPSAGVYSHYLVTTTGAGLGSVVKGFGLIEA